MKFKSIYINLMAMAANFIISFLLNFIFFQTDFKNLILLAFGTILLSSLIVLIISKKYNYKIDIFASNIEDLKYRILNDIFIGNLFSLPLAIFISILI